MTKGEAIEESISKEELAFRDKIKQFVESFCFQP
jgi:hypothetical protein